MTEVNLDEEGRLPLPQEIRQRLGWAPGQPVTLSVEANRLVASVPITAAPAEQTLASWRERARQLAEQMRQMPAAQKLREFVTDLTHTAAERLASPAALRGEPFEGARPQAPPSCYIHPAAVLIGDVVLGEDCSVWPGAVLRGDVNSIRVGARTNIQEGAVLHVDPGEGGHLEIGSGVTIGHQATVHACRIADHVLIGIQAVILDGAEIGEQCIIGAGAVVTPGTRIPPGQVVFGVPAQPAREVTPEDIQSIQAHVDSYVALKERYRHPEPTPEAPPAPPPAPPAALPRYECVRAAGPVTVDGSLDEFAWSAAGPMGFLHLSHGHGEPKLQAEVRTCWDEENLYIAFSCKDTDVWATHTRRDDPLYEEEVVEAFLCPTGDLRHYYEFELSPANVLFDARVFNPDLDRRTMLLDTDYNAAGIRTGVNVSGTLDNRDDVDTGWTAE
ncbi:MAG: hypothetical protein HY320_15640, partial [Armatimonadetes bacterium]|nr:hypothetical protein [Armatimonadota bacterium]